MNTQMLRVGDIWPNPFWRGPINKEVVNKLRESTRSTGHWRGRLVVRLRPDGKPELVAHHHLLEALRLELGEDAQVEVIVEELNDERMLRRMIRENFARRSMTALDLQAAVRAVVEAWAGGRIELAEPPDKAANAKVRWAPSFQLGHAPGGNRKHPYTATTIQPVLGWSLEKIEETLAALALIEIGLDEGWYDGLSATQAAKLTQLVRRHVDRSVLAANVYEGQAKECRKTATQPELADEERQRYEALAADAEKAALAERQRLQEGIENVAYRAYQCMGEFDAGHWVTTEFLEDPPHWEWKQVDEVTQYIRFLRWMEYRVQRFRREKGPLESLVSQAELDGMLTEQGNDVVTWGRSLRDQLQAVEEEIKRLVHEACEREAG